MVLNKREIGSMRAEKVLSVQKKVLSVQVQSQPLALFVQCGFKIFNVCFLYQ